MAKELLTDVTIRNAKPKDKEKAYDMTTLELDNETTALLAEMAEHEHTTLAQLANRLLTECLEDWQDARIAEQAIKEIESGKSRALRLDEAKRLYDQLVS